MFQRISIQRRPIWDIDIDAFQGFDNLRYLYITHCQLTKAPPIHPLTKTLVVLNLNVNNITHIHSEYFRGFDMLERLSLAMNSITSLPEMHYLNATLKTLNVHRNRLIDMASLYFVPMLKLERLSFGHNSLTNISFEHARWPAMTFISLSDNLLSTIQPFWHAAQRKTTIYLLRNPWHCNSELCWLAPCRAKVTQRKIRELVCSHNRHNLFVRVTYMGLVCNSPAERKKLRISESGKKLNRNIIVKFRIFQTICFYILASPKQDG